MTCKQSLISVCLLALVGLALAQSVPGVSEPPQGVPPLVWALLGLILPWIYETFLKKFPGWLRLITSWGLSFILVAIIGFVFLRYSLTEFLAAIGSLVIIMQAVYQLMTKPAAKARAEKEATIAAEAARYPK
jgi:4-hydroxybenzoate polyprenyltransferase